MKNNNMTHIFSLKWSRRSQKIRPLATACLALNLFAEPASRGAYPRNPSGTVGAVSADHELASQAGAEILSQGGNAVDAAIATALSLGVVQPAGSGLGGGGFLLYRKADGLVVSLDFREVAPRRAHKHMFMDAATGQVVPQRSRLGGLAIGVPGEAAGFAYALKQWGRLGTAQVVLPALRFAEQGFSVGAHLAKTAELTVPKLEPDHLLRAFLSPGGQPIAVGQIATRKNLAWTLRTLGQEGFSAFYKTDPGSIGEDLVAAARQAGGILEPEDLKQYTPIVRKPLTGRYRNHQVFTIPPPAGGLSALEALHILDARPPFSQGPGASATLHETIEALKHAFADRIKLHGDPAFTNIPLAELSSAGYARDRAATIQPDRVLQPSQYGRKSEAKPVSAPRDKGTTHLCVIDRDGNAVALTTTVNLAFGARVVGARSGVFLNNQMDDFSAKPAVGNAFGLVGDEANAVAAGKRPASSMTPLIAVAPDGRVMCVGGSGGPTIVTAVVQTVIHLVDFGMQPEAAVSSPRIHAQFIPDVVLTEPEIPFDVREKLAQRGHKLVVTPAPLENAVQVVVYRPASDGKPAHFGASADPRKGGKPAFAKPQ